MKSMMNSASFVKTTERWMKTKILELFHTTDRVRVKSGGMFVDVM
jgi:hypothetical protein